MPRKVVCSPSHQGLLPLYFNDERSRIGITGFRSDIEIAIYLPGNFSGSLLKPDHIRPTLRLHHREHKKTTSNHGRRSLIPPEGILPKFILQIELPDLLSLHGQGRHTPGLEVGKDASSICHDRRIRPGSLLLIIPLARGLTSKTRSPQLLSL